MSDKYHKVIGIDLGTTYSAVSVYNRFDEQTEMIPNTESVDGLGRLKPETTPSVVSVDPLTHKVIVGWPAKKNIGENCETIIEIKREMGENFREDTLDKFHARGNFRARQEGAGGYEGDPVKVMFSGDWRLPQEISAFTLMKMKEVAEEHIGESIIDAVITVPAYFTEKQKKATEEAAYLAGLYPRQLIPEPTAAAICYGIDRMESKQKVYLVYDLGGGTFDVSIIRVEESQISVLATSGDPRLGGGDFDDAIVAWVVEQLKTKFQLDPTGDRVKMARIKALAEQAKKDLAALATVKMSFLEIWPQQPPSIDLTRDIFEGLIESLLAKSLTFVDTALKQAELNRGLRREDVSAILLVGGSTKIPRVKKLLLNYFQQEESFVSAGLNPDEVVARGAASVALKFAPSPGPFDITKRADASLTNPEAQDQLAIGGFELITEHSLGVGVQNNLVSRIIDQGTNIPVSRREGGFTNGGPSTHFNVPVYQGEGQYSYQNTLIGTLEIGPMEPKPEGTHQFEVTFSLDDNGLLSMTIHHLNENKVYQAKFEQKTGVGGVEALAARRAKLLTLYGTPKDRLPQRGGGGPAVAMPTAPVAPGPTAGRPTGAPPAAPVAPHSEPAVAAPMAPVAPVAPSTTYSAPTSPAPTYASTSQPSAPTPAPQPAAVPASGASILQPNVDVPAEFKQTVRRSSRMLLDGGSDKLRDAFNRFVTLLNAGASNSELEEAGDQLADAYDECR